jgi:hypothetical protein
VPSTYSAGQLDPNTTSITVTGLTDGVQYHVVVAAIDASGNVGPTSDVKCGIPEPVADYWSAYKGDQGSSGGCALESGSLEQGWGLWLGASTAVAAWLRRRRRAGRGGVGGGSATPSRK